MKTAFPKFYLITPDFEHDMLSFQNGLTNSLNSGVRLIQLRSKNLDSFAYLDLAKKIVPLVHQNGAKILLNGPTKLLAQVNADGIHLPSHALCKHSTRPIPERYILSAACHNREQLNHAIKIKADIVTLSPIFATPSSPAGNPIGWENFKKLVGEIDLPIYALGGLQPKDYAYAKLCGAYGIAAKRSLWDLSNL
jgi:thiamine-phosphate diphosphorylase